MHMSPKTVNYGGKKPRFRRRTVFAKNLVFGVGYGYRNNTNKSMIYDMMDYINVRPKADM